MPPSSESLQRFPSENNRDAKPNSVQTHRNKCSQKFNENDQRHTVREQTNAPKTNHTKHKSSPAAQHPTGISYVERNGYELPSEPERSKITPIQLATRAKTIYAGLTMMESNRIHVRTIFLSQSQENLSISPSYVDCFDRFTSNTPP